jgi:hypothetical protein
MTNLQNGTHLKAQIAEAEAFHQFKKCPFRHKEIPAIARILAVQ